MTTRRILSFLILLLSCIGMFSQTTSENYILTRTFTSADSSAWRDRVVYYDGLGREEQTVLVGASPSGGDVVTLKEYDGYGRLEKTWNGAAVSGNSGGYVDISTLKTLAMQSNGSDSKPYTLTVYEPSPLERPLRQYGPGSDWHQHDRYVGTAYHTNVSGDGRLDCIRFTATQAAGTAGITVANNGSTPTGSLTVVCTTGEDRDTTYEFRELNNEVVLSRRILDGRCLDTYYVRDEWGNIMAVLPPMASEQMAASGSSWSSSSSDFLQKYAYFYCYDYRYRQIAKKLPGCAWEYTVYDKSDTPVFRQDGNLRQKGQWLYTLSDDMGRPCRTGTCRNTLNAFANPLTGNVTAVRNGNHYDPAGITLSSSQTLQQTFYDTYEGVGTASVYVAASGYGEREGITAKGQVTITKSAMLRDNTPSSAISRVHYYDYRDRVIQTQGNSHDGYHEAEYVSYDFCGNAVARKLTHGGGGYDDQFYTYAYDGWGRLTQKRHKYGSGDWLTLADNTYDPLGRLSVNRRNGVNSNKTEYTYNVRSWPTAIQNTHFSQSLYYNTVPAGLSSAPRYGGSVSSMQWELNAETHSYCFTYDGLDRIISSSYDNTLGMEDYFDTEYEYDDHGNLMYIGRYAQSATPNLYERVDDLTLTYDGNRLTDISQGSDADDFYDYTPYDDPSATSGQCTYDQNGNMTSNRRKGIASVTYNLLNLPSVISFTDGSMISYAYDMTGEKRRVEYSTAATTMEQPVAASLQSDGGTAAQTRSGSGNVTTTVDYCGSLVFQDYSLKYIRLEDDGIWDGLHGGYCFYVKDHLGNVRSVNSLNGVSIQTSQYYPFGKIWDDFSWNGSTQPFRFSGKELDKMHGLEWYDFGARMYDPGIGRFLTMDPRAEIDYSTSPYAYCGNNPIIRFDKDGRIWDTILDAAFVAYDLADAATQYISTGKVSNTTKAALTADAMAAAIPGLTGAGLAVRTGEKAISTAANAGHGLKNAKAISEGRAFEKSELAVTKASGEKVTSQVRLVPQNGKGNIKGNRSTVDQLIKKSNVHYNIIETKLTEGSSRLSKGQKAVQEHFKSGNKNFEVRSNIKDFGLTKGMTIHVDEYEIVYKYKK